MSGSGAALPLPPVAHIPGRTPRPHDDLFDDLKAGLSADLSIEELAASPAFAGAIEALSRRYYWEAHELFEAVWICLPPASAERHLLRGLVQLANAGLKARMDRMDSVPRIRSLAASSLAEAFLQDYPMLMGFSRVDIEDIERRIDDERPESDNAI